MEKIFLPYVVTLEEVYDTRLDSDFNKFITITNGILYEVTDSGQLIIIYVDDTDILSQYFDYNVVEIIDEGNYQRLLIKQ